MARLNKVNQGDGNRTVAVTYGEETLNVTYNRGALTPKVERELQEEASANRPGGALAKMLGKVIVGWDLQDVHPDDAELPEDHQRLVDVPLNSDTLDDILSIAAQAKIVEAIAEDNRPKATTSGPTKEF